MSRFASTSAVTILLGALVSCQSPPPPSDQPITGRSDYRIDVFYRGTAPPPKHSPPAEVVAAARRGLDWLISQRLPDGSWQSPYPTAVASLVLLAACHDPRMVDDDFRHFWRPTLDYLLNQEQAEGNLSAASAASKPYEHALATRALAVAASHFSDCERLDQAGRTALRYLLDRQQPEGGWHYGYVQGRHRSTPLTVVQMDALFAGRAQGWLVEECTAALQRAARSLIAVQDAQTGAFGYLQRGVGTPVMNYYALHGLQRAGYGLSPAARSGWHASLAADPLWPAQQRRPLFAAYFAHQAIYQQSGLPWREWASDFYAEWLAGQQIDGHWPAPQGEAPLGAAYATALCVLMIGAPAHEPSPVTTQPLPGPLYRIVDQQEGATIYLLPSTLTQAADAFMLDPVLMDVLPRVDEVKVEGAFRHWASHANELAQRHNAPAAALPEPTRQQLNQLAGAPRAFRSVWGDVPTWAIAAWVWSQYLDKADRQVEDLIEHTILRRLPRGMRLTTILPHHVYGDALAALPASAQIQLLEYAIRRGPVFPTLADQMADAWSQGDKERLAATTEDLLGSGLEIGPVHDQILRPARTYIVKDIQKTLAAGRHALYILPAWHLFGPESLFEQLRLLDYQIDLPPSL